MSRHTTRSQHTRVRAAVVTVLAAALAATASAATADRSDSALGVPVGDPYFPLLRQRRVRRAGTASTCATMPDGNRIEAVTTIEAGRPRTSAGSTSTSSA